MRTCNVRFMDQIIKTSIFHTCLLCWPQHWLWLGYATTPKFLRQFLLIKKLNKLYKSQVIFIKSNNQILMFKHPNFFCRLFPDNKVQIFHIHIMLCDLCQLAESTSMGLHVSIVPCFGLTRFSYANLMVAWTAPILLAWV